ncbi:UNVERIFIED_ORG: putative ATP-dependent endonuclease of OLD family [Ensifer adhaerens]|nr:putative ATP-dependent endonuclease of OLD family [Ensifer adhaerens]
MVEIRQLRINRFRGIRHLTWNPSPGLNLIVGGGDCGKTTILEAICLLFQPGNNASLNEADYWQRRTEDGFAIEATISLVDNFDLASLNKALWPWEWDGRNAVQPRSENDDQRGEQIPVFRVVLTGSPDFDLTWEIIQPDEKKEYFSLALRRRIGLLKLGSEEKNDRDLRLVYGSGLDRLLAEDNLRAKMGKLVSQVPLADELGTDAKRSMVGLSEALERAALPSEISLGMTGSQGISIGALIGLTTKKDGVYLPFTSWGAGTRRMASLQMAASMKKDAEITVIDEVERGLEPYRLHQLIDGIMEAGRQAFITSHSPLAVSLLSKGQMWFLDANGQVGALDSRYIETQQRRDPITFLSKIPVLVEGETEVGFVSEVLWRILKADPKPLGIRVTHGQGDAQLLDLLQALNDSRLTVCGFADRDGGKLGRWATLQSKMGDRLFQWSEGCIETNLIPLVPADKLESLFRDEDGDWDGNRLRSVATRLELVDKDFCKLLEAVGGNREALRGFIIKAATGSTDDVTEEDPSKKSSIVKEWKKHARHWFKKGDTSGGRELLQLVVQNDAWEKVEPRLRPFLNSILAMVGKPQVGKIVI